MKLLGKSIDYRHIISCLVTALLALSAVFIFRDSVVRAWESLVQVGLSFAFYFVFFLNLPFDVYPTIGQMPEADPGVSLPAVPSDFWANMQEVFGLLFYADNFSTFVERLGDSLNSVLVIIMALLPLGISVIMVIKLLMNKPNQNHGKDTLALKLFKKTSGILYHPVKKWFRSYIDFIKYYRQYKLIWLFIIFLNLNLVAVALSVIAYFFYLITSMNFLSLYVLFYRLFVDLRLLFHPALIPIVIIVGLYIFNRIRLKRGYSKLMKNEMRNKKLIVSLPIISMFVGSMGEGKTKVITDMALSSTIMFREKAYELLLENDFKFPLFPWINFELKLQKAMDEHKVYNLVTCEEWVLEQRERFRLKLTRKNCFNYDFKRYGLRHSDGLKQVDLFDVLSSYAQHYFIYTISTSLIISNYAIREDVRLIKTGNFPVWDNNFFKRDPRLTHCPNNSYFSHVIDFDAFRLGKFVLKNNPNKNFFEFGVINITEIGKERGNQLENKDKSKGAEIANQLNDGMNKFLKMIRHPSTVDFHPYAKLFVDEQRPESWGKDARDLCKIIKIIEKRDNLLALPFFFIEDLLHDLVFSRFLAFYSNWRPNRGDSSLISHIFKVVASCIHSYYIRINNLFGYSRNILAVEDGTGDGKVELHKYYVSKKKMYSNRYDTACYVDVFKDKTATCDKGLADIATYASTRATTEEMLLQNSYFNNDDLLRDVVGEEEVEEVDEVERTYKALKHEEKFWKSFELNDKFDKLRQASPELYKLYKPSCEVEDEEE